MQADRDNLKKQKLAELIRETAAAPPATLLPAGHWTHAIQNLVVTGGSVAIHMAPSVCPIQREGCDG